jgi:hypothetical protein
MREREGKKRGEILNEDGREIGWMEEIRNIRDSMERKGWRIQRKMFFSWNCYF